jgi:hypothetical protein
VHQQQKTKRAKTPQQIAAAAVEQWFHDVVGSTDALTSADYDENGLIAEAYDEIERLLEAEYVRQHGPIKPEDNTALVVFAREAGHLIGVQVGLRLRQGVR